MLAELACTTAPTRLLWTPETLEDEEESVAPQTSRRASFRTQQELEEMMLAPDCSDTCQEQLMASTQKHEELQSKQTFSVAMLTSRLYSDVHVQALQAG